MPLTLQQARPLAALVHQLRPEWDERGVLTALERCAGRNPLDVAMAAIRAAADLGAHTPGVIPTDGPHWRERLSETRSPRNPLPHEECDSHPGQFRLSCSGCSANRKAKREADREAAHHQARVARSESLEAARRSIRQAVSGFCSHGVDPRRCAERHQTEEDA